MLKPHITGVNIAECNCEWIDGGNAVVGTYAKFVWNWEVYHENVVHQVGASYLP